MFQYGNMSWVSYDDQQGMQITLSLKIAGPNLGLFTCHLHVLVLCVVLTYSAYAHQHLALTPVLYTSTQRAQTPSIRTWHTQMLRAHAKQRGQNKCKCCFYIKLNGSRWHNFSLAEPPFGICRAIQPLHSETINPRVGNFMPGYTRSSDFIFIQVKVISVIRMVQCLRNEV